MSALPVLVDCDPGHDDAVALLMALAVPDALEVLGITTVAGNTSVQQATMNARRICALAGRSELAVHAGCDKPLVGPHADASDFHGASGLDGWPVDAPTASPTAEEKHAVDFLIETLLARANKTTLVCLAPLTNVATALRRVPQICDKIGEIVFMGGARRAGGNVTPCATFNVFCDPHAAAVVVKSGLPLTVLSLDASSQVMITDADLAQWDAVGSATVATASAMMKYFNQRRIDRYGYARDQTPLNDPCVIAYLLDRSLFQGTQVNIEVETESALTKGMTVVDVTGVTGRAKNALWLDQADGVGVRRAVLDCIQRLG
jgi:purine nucleosidase